MASLERLSRAIRETCHKHFRAGTHRTVAPEDTIRRVEGFRGRMQITRVADVTGLDTIGIPVAVVCRPNSRSLAVSQGKGLTVAAAKASALMESIELYHAERIALPIKYNSFEDLASDHALADVEGLPRTRHRQFQAHRLIPWIEGYNLIDHSRVWVPYELVHTNYTLDSTIHPGVFSATSNGLASGNHPLEAISHAICEVIERDASTLWYHLDDVDQRECRVALPTIDDPACRVVLEKYEAASVAVAVWETTTDIGLPAFLCMIVDRVDDPSRPIAAASGMGCHPTRPIALLRALTEAAQSRLTVTTGSRDDVTRADHERHQSASSRSLARRMILEQSPSRSFRDVPTLERETFNGDVSWEIERLEAAGVRQAIVVDLTLSAFDIPVVRVVVPGLEGMHESPDYVPGPRATRLGRKAP